MLPGLQNKTKWGPCRKYVMAGEGEGHPENVSRAWLSGISITYFRQLPPNPPNPPLIAVSPPAPFQCML